MVEGTIRKDRDRPEPDFPQCENPPPPSWLNDPEAVTEWHRLSGLLCAQGILTDADLSTLGHLCNLHAHLTNLWTAKVPPDAAIVTQYRLLGVEFGLTPKSRPNAAKNPGAASAKNQFEKLALG